MSILSHFIMGCLQFVKVLLLYDFLLFRSASSPVSSLVMPWVATGINHRSLTGASHVMLGRSGKGGVRQVIYVDRSDTCREQTSLNSP